MAVYAGLGRSSVSYNTVHSTDPTSRGCPSFVGFHSDIRDYVSRLIGDGTFTVLIISSSISGLYASLSLYKRALAGVLRSRVSFFDTTPMGSYKP